MFVMKLAPRQYLLYTGTYLRSAMALTETGWRWTGHLRDAQPTVDDSGTAVSDNAAAAGDTTPSPG